MSPPGGAGTLSQGRRVGLPRHGPLDWREHVGASLASTMSMDGLPARWRARADELEPYSPPAAHAFRVAADEMDAAVAFVLDELLTPAQIETLGRCSAETVRRAVRDDPSLNEGTPGAIKVRARNLVQLPPGRRTRTGEKRISPTVFGDLAMAAAMTLIRSRDQER